MKNMLEKVTSIILALIFLLNPSYAFAVSLEEENISNKLLDTKQDCSIEPTAYEIPEEGISHIDLDGKNLLEHENVLDSDENIAFSVDEVKLVLAKYDADSAFVPLSNHAIKRATERGITPHNFARTLSFGIQFTHTETEARILYDTSTKTTLVLDKVGGIVITTYNNSPIKATWVPFS